MSSGPDTVEQWKERNADRLVQCRWGCEVTREACRSYQAKRKRYTVYFRTHGTGETNVNEYFIQCLKPNPCSHLIPDEELELDISWETPEELNEIVEKRTKLAEIRRREQLVDPNEMLNENDGARSGLD